MYDKVDVRMTSREVSWVIAGLTRPGVEKTVDETPKKKNRRKNSIRKIFSLSLVHEKNEEIGVKWKGWSEVARELRKIRTFSSPPWTLCFRFDSPFNFLSPSFLPQKNVVRLHHGWIFSSFRMPDEACKECESKWSIIVQLFGTVTVNHKAKQGEFSLLTKKNIVTFFSYFFGARTHQKKASKQGKKGKQKQPLFECVVSRFSFPSPMRRKNWTRAAKTKIKYQKKKKAKRSRGERKHGISIISCRWLLVGLAVLLVFCFCFFGSEEKREKKKEKGKIKCRNGSRKEKLMKIWWWKKWLAKKKQQQSEKFSLLPPPIFPPLSESVWTQKRNEKLFPHFFSCVFCFSRCKTPKRKIKVWDGGIQSCWNVTTLHRGVQIQWLIRAAVHRLLLCFSFTTLFPFHRRRFLSLIICLFFWWKRKSEKKDFSSLRRCVWPPKERKKQCCVL